MRAKIIQEKPKCFFLFSSKKNLGVRLIEVFLSLKTGQLKKVFLKSEKKKIRHIFENAYRSMSKP